jgi:hypothetical protein
VTSVEGAEPVLIPVLEISLALIRIAFGKSQVTGKLGASPHAGSNEDQRLSKLPFAKGVSNVNGPIPIELRGKREKAGSLPVHWLF